MGFLNLKITYYLISLLESNLVEAACENVYSRTWP